MTIFYPDVSQFQDDENLKGALAVCARATEGDWLADPDYLLYKKQAHDNRQFFFAYHFLEDAAHSSAAAQAQFCFDHTGKDVPLMLDFEPIGNPGGGYASEPTVDQAKAFIDAYRALGGTVYALYLPRWYWEALGSPSLRPFTRRHMFLVSSDYTGYSDNGPGWQPYGGMTPKVWQYTSAGPGSHPTDWNAFKGTLAELKNTVRTGKPGPALKSKIIRAHVTTDGRASLRELLRKHADCKVSTSLRLTAVLSRKGMFTPAMAAYVNEGKWDLPLPPGQEIWFLKKTYYRASLGRRMLSFLKPGR